MQAYDRHAVYTEHYPLWSLSQECVPKQELLGFRWPLEEFALPLAYLVPAVKLNFETFIVS